MNIVLGFLTAIFLMGSCMNCGSCNGPGWGILLFIFLLSIFGGRK